MEYTWAITGPALFVESKKVRALRYWRDVANGGALDKLMEDDQVPEWLK
jgi:hypothetical protein